MKKIKDHFISLVFGGLSISIIGVILMYVIGMLCMPVAIIWALYKIVTYFTK